jgi:antitoxin (DNA-binding transcriptional repressor) of toxin-antitoxin stability system
LQKVTAEEYEARCLELLDRVVETRQPIGITRQSRVVARLEPTTGDTRSLERSVRLHLAEDDLVDASIGPWDIEQ